MSSYKRTKQDALMARAKKVVPGGVYGHAVLSPDSHPRFFRSGNGCRVVDVDGNEYIDFMCSFGPNLVGFNHPRVEKAAAAQRALGNCFTGPTERWVELAEELVRRIGYADWAMFQKNGSDATSLCNTIARAFTGKRKILLADGAYHTAAPWGNPSKTGVIDEDRAHLLYYRYNDLESVQAALREAGDDLAGIMVSPFKHDAFVDQELVDPDFARGLRAVCDEHSALLMMDEVRAGLRLAPCGSWERMGVHPDIAAWGKGIANGYALSTVVGREALRETAAGLYSTGSFWYSAVPMAAALETLRIVDEENLVGHIERVGTKLRQGLDTLATSHGFRLRQTGPPQMPLVMFEEDTGLKMGQFFTTDAMTRGVFLHPFHNMFLCGAHTENDIDIALERLDDSFLALRSAVADGL